jgi:hypothetical protein
MPVGLATAGGGLAEIAAGVLGTAAAWVASTGSRAAGREAQTPRLVGACERQARGFLGARCFNSSVTSCRGSRTRGGAVSHSREQIAFPPCSCPFPE